MDCPELVPSSATVSTCYYCYYYYSHQNKFDDNVFFQIISAIELLQERLLYSQTFQPKLNEQKEYRTGRQISSSNKKKQQISSK